MALDQPLEIVIAGESRFQQRLAQVLPAGSFACRKTAGAAEMIDLLAERPAHVVLLQFDAPEADPLQVLARLQQEQEDLAVIMLAHDPPTEAVVRCLKHGVRDFLKFPEDLSRLPELIHEICQGAGPQTEPAATDAGAPGRDGLLGACPQMQQIRKRIQRLSRVKWVTVLILGETGTGKEVVARAIHNASTVLSHEGNFIEVNCTALPANLLEAELFGYERGAFTDAKTRKQGLFELAEGGTLFLDEIGDMSLLLQAKLLKAIEEKRFRRLGGTVDVQVNTRIIAGTNADLRRAVAAGQFRQDLFYRLNVVTLELPPLRERGADILLLARHFLRQFRLSYEIAVTGFSPEAEDYLLGYPWPGNVRELKHAVERAVLLGEAGEITLADLRSALGLTPPTQPVSPQAYLPTTNPLSIPTDGLSLKEGERRLIEEILKLTKWNRTKAAEILGISRPRLKRKMEEYRLGNPHEEPGF